MTVTAILAENIGYFMVPESVVAAAAVAETQHVTVITTQGNHTMPGVLRRTCGAVCFLHLGCAAAGVGGACSVL